MNPLFTVHAGELIVGSKIERDLRGVNVWVPAKDTGIDLLLSNNDNSRTISLQVKLSRDYLVSNNKKDAVFHEGLRACGWWTLNREKIKNSRAQYWVFVLLGFANRTRDFIIIRPDILLKRLDNVHGKKAKTFQSYLWVTQKEKCYETRGLNREDETLVAQHKFKNDVRDFSAYLNDWTPIRKALVH